MKSERPILVLEDDPDVGSTITAMLRRDGWNVSLAATLAEGYASLAACDPCIVIVDLGLPDGSGMNMVRAAAARARTGVIVVSGRGEEMDRVVGLEVGADDYIAKPFSAREVNARVTALHRRLGGGRQVPEVPPQVVPPSEARVSLPLLLGGVTLDPGRLRITRADGTVVSLTGGEADLLSELMQAGGEAVTREAATERVLGHRLQTHQRGIDQLASGLRQKLDSLSGGSIRIVAVRGKGYRLIDR